MADTNTIPEDDKNFSSEQQRGGVRDRIANIVAKQKTIDTAIRAATKAISVSMNSALLAGIEIIWGFVVGSLGLAAILGALVADAAALFKGPIISAFTKRLLPSSLRDKSKDIASQIKFSTAVKVNILLLNLVAVLVAFFYLILIAAIIKGLCDGWITGASLKLSGYGGICKQIDSIGAPAAPIN